MKPILKRNKGFEKDIETGRQTSKWYWGWRLKNQSIPIRGGCDSLFHAIKRIISTWDYAYKAN
jgi:hypothetical protein